MTATTEFPPGIAPDGEMKNQAGDWRSRSCEELREIVSHGIAGGAMFIAASNEIERRAKEADDTIHAQEAAIHSQARRIGWLALILIGVIVALAVVRLFGLRA